MRNYYHVLGLDPTCSIEEIKTAFKQHAKHFHPDKHQGDEFFKEKFIEVKDAYDLLINPGLRKTHDEYHKFKKPPVNTEPSPQQPNQQTTSGSTAGMPNVENHIEWATQKLNNNDFYGAMEEVKLAERLDPMNGWIIWNKGKILESSGYIKQAYQQYNKALKLNYRIAIQDIIKIKKLQNNVKVIYKPYFFYAPAFCLVGVLIFFLFDRSGKALIIGEVINIVGGIFILRIPKGKVSPAIRLSLNSDVEMNFLNLFSVIAIISALPIILHFIGL